MDCIINDGQALIFADTRKRAVSLALKASDIIGSLISDEDKIKLRSVANAILDSDDTELANNLAFAVSNGVAFHHAGLNHTCRKLVEYYYRQGLIKLIAATPTLASGVNLPARRVIISSIRRFDIEQGMQEISVMEYKQMCGRAGRPKYDEYGEAIIIANDPELILDTYINADPEPLRSSLLDDDNLKMHLLGVIASNPAISYDDLLELFSNTFMAKYYRTITIKRKLKRMIDYLAINDLIDARGDKVTRFIATDIGKLASLLYLHPDTAILFKDSINSLNNEIEVLNLITQAKDFTPKIQLRSKDYDELELLDVDASNRSLLALYAWINEHSERYILDKLAIEPGDLYRIIESSDWLLYSLQEFARHLNNTRLLNMLSDLRIRVKHGVKKELIELVSIKDIGRVRARALYNAGFKSIDDLRHAPINKLARIPKIGSSIAKKIKSSIER